MIPRRDRNLSSIEEFPHWLTGRGRPKATVMEGLPLAAAAGPIELALPAEPTDVGDRAEFLARMDHLTQRMFESDRRLLLEMATKLADRRSV